MRKLLYLFTVIMVMFYCSGVSADVEFEGANIGVDAYDSGE